MGGDAEIVQGPSVQLTWAAPLGMWSFVVFRSIDSNSGFTSLGSAVDARAYLDIDVNAGSRYFYFVDAVSFDSSGFAVSGPSSDTIGVNVTVPGGAVDGVLAGSVGDSSTGAPLPFVVMRIVPVSRVMMPPFAVVFTDMNGNYEARVDTGTYLICTQPGANTGYASQWYNGADDSTKATPVHVSMNESVRADFGLHLLSSSTQAGGLITGTVFDDSTLSPLRDVTVRFVPQNTNADHNAFLSVLTDSLGRYSALTDAEDYLDQIIPASIAPGTSSISGINSTTVPSSVPDSYVLSQNFPNPFNPSTNISAELPTASRVSLIVYDVLGNKVAVLMNGVYAPGTYTIRWDASRFASGVYFYHFTASSGGNQSYSQVRSMIMLK